MKIQEYVLKEEFIIGRSLDSKTLPAGSFVKPMNISYLPKHCLQASSHLYFDAYTHVYCYTHYGFLPIPKNIIVEVTW
jgi:hypothetical protein